MENINFRGIPTSLFLNGPKLGISSDPQDQLEKVGVATFTGIATASFPDANFALDGGSISFKWYYDGSQILDTTEDLNSNASIEFFDDEVDGIYVVDPLRGKILSRDLPESDAI